MLGFRAGLGGGTTAIYLQRLELKASVVRWRCGGIGDLIALQVRWTGRNGEERERFDWVQRVRCWVIVVNW